MTTVWVFLKLFAFFAFPQLLGVLIFFRIHRHQVLIARITAFLTPLALHLVLSWLFFLYSYYQHHPEERCGGPMLGAMAIILFGLVVHTALGGFVQAFLPRSSIKPQ